MGERLSRDRVSRAKIAAGIWVASALLCLSCASLTRPAPVKPAARPGPWETTYAQYDPSLFGPERPLGELIAQYHLKLENGKLQDGRLLLNKAQRRLELWVKRRMVKAYRIQLGANPVGRKTRRGDQRTPEGRYYICSMGPAVYCDALWISYPNAEDAREGLRAGVINRGQYDAIENALKKGDCPPQDTALGGYVWLHGQLPEHTEEAARKQRANPAAVPAGLRVGDIEPSSVREFYDWTAGCAALFNPDIRELYEFIPKGTPLTIVANGPLTPPPKSKG